MSNQVISPYAKPGFIDHSRYQFESMLKFIEWRFNIPSNKSMSLLGPHSVVITTHESYLPTTPLFEQMQHKNMTSTNSTQK